ncbi:MAG TPA: hypothetical protein VFK39_00945 [Gemmatimonadaceae bacterium]|nr:hypothetical protein [Gemmatimonadaceae bacterium]
MTKLSVRTLSSVHGVLQLGLVLVLAACSGGILAPDRSRGPGADSNPFYYYEHEPIYLKVDPTGMVVLPIDALASDSAAVRTALETRLSAHGLEIAAMRPLGGPPSDWLVQFAGTVDPDAAAAARTELLYMPEFRAVIPTYRSMEGDLPLYVLNRAVAKFKDGVSRVQIASLVSSLGAEVTIVQNWGPAGVSYIVEAAPGSRAHILDIANAIDESSIALWGSPDMVDPNIRPTSLSVGE